MLAFRCPRIFTVVRARAAPRTPPATAHVHVQYAGRRLVELRRPPARCSSRADFSCSRRRGGVFSAVRRGRISPLHGSGWRAGRKRERFHTIPTAHTTTTIYVVRRIGTKLRRPRSSRSRPSTGPRCTRNVDVHPCTRTRTKPPLRTQTPRATAAPASRAVCHPTALSRALFPTPRLRFRRRRDARWGGRRHDQLCAFVAEGLYHKLAPLFRARVQPGEWRPTT